MAESSSHFARRVLSGQQRGIRAALLRAALRAVEPIYAAIIRGRNALYDRGLLPTQHIPVPVISVGNITVGGTGKTPVVRWLAQRMRHAGLRPAILLRGYRRDRANLSDEAEMLHATLNDGQSPPVVVHAEPDRVAGATCVLRQHAETNLIILDDGFQHRRIARDFDLVLIDATNPFGYDHVLPRGLLREPLAGLRRAGAFILTHADQLTDDRRNQLELLLRSYNAAAPTYRTRHELPGLRSAQRAMTLEPDIDLAELSRLRFYAAAGIAQPANLDRQLAQLGKGYCGGHWFDDHHHYCAADLDQIRRLAKKAGADVIVVTEKDWAKMHRMDGAMDQALPIWRLEMRIAFDANGEAGLLELIRTRIERHEPT